MEWSVDLMMGSCMYSMSSRVDNAIRIYLGEYSRWTMRVGVDRDDSELEEGDMQRE